jgi:hypothetical protein
MRILPLLVLAAAPAFAAASDSPASVVAALWQGLSHAPGVAADVARLETLFRGDAIVAGGRYSQGQPSFSSMKAAEFIASQRAPRPAGFHECEVAREVRQYDRFASVYSVVESRRDPKAPRADFTGVNSIQLYRGEDGWKIVSLYYHVEKADLPIPLAGGKPGVCLDA